MDRIRCQVRSDSPSSCDRILQARARIRPRMQRCRTRGTRSRWWCRFRPSAGEHQLGGLRPVPRFPQINPGEGRSRIPARRRVGLVEHLGSGPAGTPGARRSMSSRTLLRFDADRLSHPQPALIPLAYYPAPCRSRPAGVYSDQSFDPCKNWQTGHGHRSPHA